MLYTLLKFLGWGALLAFIGGCIGWALRALKCRGEVARARAATVDHDEVVRMRHRLANLEQVVAERDRLRIQLADVRHADSPGVVGALVDDAETRPIERVGEFVDESPKIVADAASDVDVHDEDAGATDDGEAGDDAADDAKAAGVPVDDSTDDADADAGEAPTGAAVAGLAAVPDLVEEPPSPADAGADADADAESIGEPPLDLAAAAAVLGKKIKLDDLTVVEGIGPKISQLCSAIGITTWRQLADTDVAELQSMLDAAGSRYSVHKPGTWPRQSGLLAAGEWEAFTTFTDELSGGR